VIDGVVDDTLYLAGPPMDDRDFGVGEETAQGEAAQGNHYLGSYQGHLPIQVGLAGLYLVEQGVAIPRGTALDDIADIYILSPKADASQEFFQELPRGADEGAALLVFMEAWRFPNEDYLCLLGPLARHGVSPRLGEDAFLATDDLLVELLKFWCHNRVLLLSTALGTELGVCRHLLSALGAGFLWAERGSTFGAKFSFLHPALY